MGHTVGGAKKKIVENGKITLDKKLPQSYNKDTKREEHNITK